MKKQFPRIFLSLLLMMAFMNGGSRLSLATDFRTIPNRAFGINEYLRFSVDFGMISAGEAFLRIPEIVQVKGRPCYRIISEIRSNDFVSTFFKVDDYVESLVDVDGLFPWQFQKRLSEGKYRSERKAVFDYTKGVVYDGRDTVSVPPFTQDVLSVFYFLRTQPLQVGATVPIDNYADGKLYPIQVKVLRREKVKVPAGKFDCYVIEPGFRGSGIFSQKGKLEVWLTADHRKLLVKMRSQIAVGSITLELNKYRSDVK